MAKRNNQTGFTLIELMITVAVAMILIAAFPVARGAMPEIRVNKYARSLAQDLRAARAMAVEQGTDVIVAFDLNQSRVNYYLDNERDGIEVSDLARSRLFSDYGIAVSITAVTTSGIDGAIITSPIKFGATSSPIAVTFHANGSATNVGVVYLAPVGTTNNETGRAVEVLSTGKVSTWKYDITGSLGPWKKWL